jgi:hypothetical protein
MPFSYPIILHRVKVLCRKLSYEIHTLIVRDLSLHKPHDSLGLCKDSTQLIGCVLCMLNNHYTVQVYTA